MMLGSQRAGVTIVLGMLKKAGVVEHERGNFTILSRVGLEDAACECYCAMHIELNKVFGRQKIETFVQNRTEPRAR